MKQKVRTNTGELSPGLVAGDEEMVLEPILSGSTLLGFMGQEVRGGGEAWTTWDRLPQLPL